MRIAENGGDPDEVAAVLESVKRRKAGSEMIVKLKHVIRNRNSTDVTLRVVRGLKIDFYQQGRTSPSAKEGLRSSLRHRERKQHELGIPE